MNSEIKTWNTNLPSPQTDSIVSLEQTLLKRRSHRNFLNDAINLEELSQILWAAYGITKSKNFPPSLQGGFKTAPSAGATYPLNLYAVAGNVKGIETGVYRYISLDHKLKRMIDEDVRQFLAQAAFDQEMIRIAPAAIFFSAVFERATKRYGNRGRDRYVCTDLGHSAQNVYLQAEALNLGTCAIGAFNDKQVREVMQLSEEEEPLYIMPVGKY
ncbi:hypothetical protein ES705_29417 [subsurface metagenome]